MEDKDKVTGTTLSNTDALMKATPEMDEKSVVLTVPKKKLTTNNHSEASFKAKKKYLQSGKKKQLLIQFFPKDHDVFEACIKKGKEYGSRNAFLIDTLRQVLNVPEQKKEGEEEK